MVNMFSVVKIVVDIRFNAYAIIAGRLFPVNLFQHKGHMTVNVGVERRTVAFTKVPISLKVGMSRISISCCKLAKARLREGGQTCFTTSTLLA